MKKVRTSMIVASLLMINMPTEVYAEWYNPTTWFGEKKDNLKPATFDLVYPVPFYKTKLFKWGGLVVASVAVAAASVGSGGAAAIPGATWIGSLVGGLMGTTWTAGLAMLGGGTLAAGGLGMAGGAVVIATVTDLSLAVLVDQVASAIPGKNQNTFTTIKIPIPKWDYGSEYVLSAFENIHELQEKLMDGEIMSQEVYTKNLTTYMKDALAHINVSESKYDAINGAILAYDLGQFEKAEKYISIAYSKFPSESSLIYYIQALLSLSKGDTEAALSKLSNAIEIEPDVLTPYLLKINVLLDENRLDDALLVVKLGLKNYDDENFQLNYLAGMITYKKGDYKEAIEYYEEALSNTMLNPVEAECKVRIALSYKKLHDTQKAKKWFDDAMDELDDKEYDQYREQVVKMFNNS